MGIVLNQQSEVSKIKQIIFLSAGKIIALLFTLLLPLFLVRFFSQQQYGLYCQFYASGQFLASVFALCLSTNVFYFGKNIPPTQIKTLLLNNVLMMLLGGFLAALCLFCPWIGKFLVQNYEVKNFTVFLALYIFMEILISMVESFYILQKDNTMAILYPIAMTISKAVFVLLFCLIFKNFTSLFIGILFSELFILLWGYIYMACKSHSFGGTYHIEGKLLKAQLKYSIPYSFANTISTLCDRFDKLLGISFFLPAEYAIYSTAFLAIPGVQQITGSMGAVYVVDMTVAIKKNDYAEALRLFRELSGKILSLTIPIIIGVCIFADSFIEILFGSKYSAATPLFQIHIITLLFATFGGSLLTRATGKTSKSFYSYLYSGVIMIPVTYFGMKMYGMLGGIICSTVSCILPRIILSYYEIRIMNTTLKHYLPWKPIFKITVYSFTWGIPFALLHIYWKIHPFFNLFLCTVYLLIVFGIEIKKDIFIMDKTIIKKKIYAVYNHCATVFSRKGKV